MNVGGAPDGGVSRWVLGLVGAWLSQASPVHPREGSAPWPTERRLWADGEGQRGAHD